MNIFPLGGVVLFIKFSPAGCRNWTAVFWNITKIKRFCCLNFSIFNHTLKNPIKMLF